MKINVNVKTFKIISVLCLLLSITIYRIENISAATIIELNDYSYEDYLRDKETEEQIHKKKMQDLLVQAITWAIAISFIGVVCYALYKSKRQAIEQKAMMEENSKISEQQRKEKIWKELHKCYPQFTLERLQAFLLIQLKLIQKAIENKDYDKLKVIETEAFYKIHSDEIRTLGTNKKYANKQKILNFEIESFLTGAYDTISVIVKMQLIEFIYDQQTMKLVKGNEHKEVIRNYQLELTRKTTIDELSYDVCPHCGAPIELDDLGRCSYCRSLLQRNNSTWRINNYKEIQ